MGEQGCCGPPPSTQRGVGGGGAALPPSTQRGVGGRGAARPRRDLSPAPNGESEAGGGAACPRRDLSWSYAHAVRPGSHRCPRAPCTAQPQEVPCLHLRSDPHTGPIVSPCALLRPLLGLPLTQTLHQRHGAQPQRTPGTKWPCRSETQTSSPPVSRGPPPPWTDSSQPQPHSLHHCWEAGPPEKSSFSQEVPSTPITAHPPQLPRQGSHHGTPHCSLLSPITAPRPPTALPGPPSRHTPIAPPRAPITAPPLYSPQGPHHGTPPLLPPGPSSCTPSPDCPPRAPITAPPIAPSCPPRASITAPDRKSVV